MKMEEGGSAEQQAPVTVSSCRVPTCPPWLQAAIADMEQRVRAVAVDEAAPEHSFAERAENYYQKRPQLLALLTDLHHRYLCLADRYAQSLLQLQSKHHHAADDRCSSDSDSDAGSSLSFQQQSPASTSSDPDPDVTVAELVAAWVERDILADEAERRRAEAARKIELQGSLVEVLESERLVLLGENARLAFRASAAEEELGYARRRAAEMARLVVKLREDHRVCMLGRKIEALQAQVYALELRNRHCYDAMANWEADRKAGAAEIQRLRAENRRLAEEAAGARRRKGKGSGWWWSRVRMAAECRFAMISHARASRASAKQTSPSSRRRSPATRWTTCRPGLLSLRLSAVAARPGPARRGLRYVGMAIPPAPERGSI
ncbi:unnamed protein product [Urochloa humidicola]